MTVFSYFFQIGALSYWAVWICHKLVSFVVSAMVLYVDIPSYGKRIIFAAVVCFLVLPK